MSNPFFQRRRPDRGDLWCSDYETCIHIGRFPMARTITQGISALGALFLAVLLVALLIAAPLAFVILSAVPLVVIGLGYAIQFVRDGYEIRRKDSGPKGDASDE